MKNFCSLCRQQLKSFQLLNPQESGPSRVKTDWKKCCLCQKVTNELLQCPAKSNRVDIGIGQGYSTLSANIMHHNELHELPMPVDLERLDEGSGIQPTLMPCGTNPAASNSMPHKYEEQRRGNLPQKTVS